MKNLKAKVIEEYLHEADKLLAEAKRAAAIFGVTICVQCIHDAQLQLDDALTHLESFKKPKG